MQVLTIIVWVLRMISEMFGGPPLLPSGVLVSIRQSTPSLAMRSVFILE